MLNFKKIEEKDILFISEYFEYQPYKLCDYSIGTIYTWKEYYNTMFCTYKDYLLIKFQDENGNCVFAFPIKKGKNPVTIEEARADESLTEVLNVVKECTAKNGCQCVFTNLTEELAEVVKDIFPDCTIECSRDWADYLYAYEDLAELKGRKYSSKRNHISRFNRDYPNHRIVEITEENIDCVKEFYKNVYLKEHSLEGTDEEEHMEAKSTKRMLNDFFKLKQKGIFVEVSGEIAAFTIGETVADTLVVHIEKALTRYNGIYSFINKEFVCFSKVQNPDILYVNREEDVGDEGLRKSKLSYHPVKLLLKHLARVPNGN